MVNVPELVGILRHSTKELCFRVSVTFPKSELELWKTDPPPEICSTSVHLSVSGHAKVNGITSQEILPGLQSCLPLGALECQLLPLTCGAGHALEAGTGLQSMEQERDNTQLTALHGWRSVCRSLYWIPHGSCTLHFKTTFGNVS